MGTLHHGNAQAPIEIDDHTLAHLKAAAAATLRRRQSFLVSWIEPESRGRGRATLWIHPSSEVVFSFTDPRPVTLDPELLADMSQAAASPHGIRIDVAP